MHAWASALIRDGLLGEGVAVNPVILAELCVGDIEPDTVAARNRTDGKHVDFVVCDGGSMQPLLAIELDDASHQRKDSQESDDFKNRAFAAAGLPLLRVKAARAYVPQEIGERIRTMLRTPIPKS